MSKANQARPASEQRGELSLTLNGMTMVLRPSWEAIEAFELATGKGLLQLAREALTGSLKVAEAAQIASECVRAWGRDTGDENASGSNAKRIAQLMIEADGGYHAALVKIASVLSLASTGGYTAKGEVKAAAALTAGTAAAD